MIPIMQSLVLQNQIYYSSDHLIVNYPDFKGLVLKTTIGFKNLEEMNRTNSMHV